MDYFGDKKHSKNFHIGTQNDLPPNTLNKKPHPKHFPSPPVIKTITLKNPTKRSFSQLQSESLSQTKPWSSNNSRYDVVTSSQFVYSAMKKGRKDSVDSRGEKKMNS